MVTWVLIALLAQTDAAAEAKAAYDQATELFKQDKYAEALPHFQKAYELSGRRASTMLALAQCERALKMFDEALLHFREYLDTDPEDKADIRETIRLVEAEQRKKNAPPPPPTVTPPPPPPTTAVVAPPPAVEDDTSLTEEPVFWVLLIGGVAVVAGGIALGVTLGGGEADPYAGTTGVIIRPGES